MRADEVVKEIGAEVAKEAANMIDPEVTVAVLWTLLDKYDEDLEHQVCGDAATLIRLLQRQLREEKAKVERLQAEEAITGETSDGYHTFNELYHHRAVLFSVICNDRPQKAWKSKKHHDGTMYDGMFIVGVQTPEGQATYHYDIEPYWDMFHVPELSQAPEWDGHTSEQAIERIGRLSKHPRERPTLRQMRDDLTKRQAELGITDDMSHLQFLLNTIGEQKDRALKAETELRRCYKDLEQLTAERTDLKAMLADAGIRNAVLAKRLSRLLGMYADIALGQCGKDCELMGDDVMANISQCKVCLRDEAIGRLEQEVQP